MPALGEPACSSQCSRQQELAVRPGVRRSMRALGPEPTCVTVSAAETTYRPLNVLGPPADVDVDRHIVTLRTHHLRTHHRREPQRHTISESSGWRSVRSSNHAVSRSESRVMRPRIHAAARRRDRRQMLLGACCSPVSYLNLAHFCGVSGTELLWTIEALCRTHRK